ncbi:hypothetical protein LOD99_11677 [Oopsacas minuta]|uniref:RNA helicase n=1 Tax=Oopsacas minuta TaxID=111878 RepID=A0AAV7JKK7_9METZ|nr:hypothetical protein LOD99_11677 [Oopsacas minuta]
MSTTTNTDKEQAIPANIISCSELENLPDNSSIPTNEVTPNVKEQIFSNIPTEQIIQNFQELKLNTELYTNLKVNGYVKPTDIQSHILFPLVQGKSMLIESKPGTGKLTSLYILLLQRCRLSSMRIQGIIVTGNTVYCSTIEMNLSLLSEEVTAINLDELEVTDPGEVADHQFMMGSEQSIALLSGVINVIKIPIILCLYNINIQQSVLMDKITSNLTKFNQIVIMRDQTITIDYKLITKLLTQNAMHLSVDMQMSGPSHLTGMFKQIHQIETIPKPQDNSKQDISPANTEYSPAKQEQIQETPNLEVLRKLESGDKIIEFFLKHDLSLKVPTFYVFVFNYLFKGLSVVQTGYKSVERINLISLVVKEFDRHLTAPVHVVICHDGKEFKDSKLLANPSVYIFQDEETLNDIPKDKTIIIASSSKTLSVLKSFPNLFHSTGRIIVFYNISIGKFKDITQLFPQGLLFLAMLKCQIESIAGDIQIPFVNVAKHENNLNIEPFSGAKISPDDLSCLEELTREKTSLPQKFNTNQDFHKSRFHTTNREDHKFEDSRTMPRVVSINLLQTISAKHGINPKAILPFYPEVFSFSIRGDNILLIGFQQSEYSSIVNIVSLERVSNSTEPGCQVLVYYGSGEEADLCDYPNCKRLLSGNENSILDICPLVSVDTIRDITRLYTKQNAKFYALKKLIVLVGVTLDECIEIISNQIPCQLIFILTDIPTDDHFNDLPVSFVRFLNHNNSVKIEKVGQDDSLLTDENTQESSPELVNESPSDIPDTIDNTSKPVRPTQQTSMDNEFPQQTTSLARAILVRNNETVVVDNMEFFTTALSHTIGGNNILIREFSKEIITSFVTILYQDYCVNIPGNDYVLFCLGSRISDLFLPSFKCPSSLWLQNDKNISVQPNFQKEAYFLTITRLLNMIHTELECLVNRTWLIVFIGLSHKEIESCIPYIPLSNQYLFILSIEHPQFKKFMSAPYVVIRKTRRKLVTTEWVHKSKMKSFKTEYKQTNSIQQYDNNVETTTTTTIPPTQDSKENNRALALHAIASSILNSGKHVLLQATRSSGKTTLAFDYSIYNIDRNSKCVQVIFSSPSIFKSVKLFTDLNQYLKRNNETEVKAFLHAKGDSSQLSAYLENIGFHVLVTTNDSLSKLIKESSIIHACGLIVFDELYSNADVDQVTAMLPTLFHDSIPRGIQCIFITSSSEDVTKLLRFIPMSFFYIHSTRETLQKSTYSIDCYF